MLFPIAPFAGAFGAAIVRTDRRIVRTLSDAGATGPATAISLDGGALQRMRVSRLTRVGALARVSGDRYHLVEPAWRAYNIRRRKRVLVAVAITLAVVWAVFRVAG